MPRRTHTHRNAALDDHLGEADPRHVSLGHHARQQVDATVGRHPGRWIEHALGLVRIIRVGVHHLAEAGQAVRNHPFTADPRSLDVKWRWNTMNSPMTGAASTHAPAITDPNGLATVAWRLER